VQVLHRVKRDEAQARARMREEIAGGSQSEDAIGTHHARRKKEKPESCSRSAVDERNGNERPLLPSEEKELRRYLLTKLECEPVRNQACLLGNAAPGIYLRCPTCKKRRQGAYDYCRHVLNDVDVLRENVRNMEHSADNDPDTGRSLCAAIDTADASGASKPGEELDFGDRQMLRPAEAAVLVGRCKNTLYRYRKQGIGPAYYEIGRSIRYSKSDVDAWLKSRETEAQAQAGQAGNGRSRGAESVPLASR